MQSSKHINPSFAGEIETALRENVSVVAFPMLVIAPTAIGFCIKGVAGATIGAALTIPMLAAIYIVGVGIAGKT